MKIEGCTIVSNVRRVPTQCESCGGQLEQVDKNTYRCIHCDSQYYVSTTSLHKVGVHIPVKTIVVRLAIAITALIIVSVAAYQIYTAVLVKDASRFSVVFRDFLLQVYDKPVADIDKEDLAQIKYLRIERQKGSYRITYSFEDYYDYYDAEVFEQYTDTIAIKESITDFSPSNVQYFTGLTRLELYTDSWHNYVLPKQNQLRSIVCCTDVSRYGNSTFFENVNPDTLEEVVVYSEENMDEDRYLLEDIKMVRNLCLERVVYDDPDMLKDFEQLEQLYLLYPVIEEDAVYETVEGILQCSNLKRLVIEGKAAWHLTDEEWALLQETYGDRVELERK